MLTGSEQQTSPVPCLPPTPCCTQNRAPPWNVPYGVLGKHALPSWSQASPLFRAIQPGYWLSAPPYPGCLSAHLAQPPAHAIRPPQLYQVNFISPPLLMLLPPSGTSATEVLALAEEWKPLGISQNPNVQATPRPILSDSLGGKTSPYPTPTSNF